jgi:Lrp/AsnC family leucine-responsive transcriptional regulator
MTTLDSERVLDDVGWRLLGELQRDARLSYSELGRRVGLSAPAVIERLRRMETLGFISGYHAQLNLGRLGLAVQAIIRLRPSERGRAGLPGALEQVPEILECHRVTGDDCYVMRVAVPSVQHLEALLDRLSPHGATTTSIVLSTPVNGRVVGPPSNGLGINATESATEHAPNGRLRT